MTYDEDELTAYHEAGHAVVALVYGGKIVRLSVEPENDDGINRYGESIVQWFSVSDSDFCVREVAVSLAGPVAEMSYCSSVRPIGLVPEFVDDWQRAMKAASNVAKDQFQLRQLLRETQGSLEEFCETQSNWAAISAVADALMAHGTLEHEEIAEIVEFWIPA